MSSRKRRPNWTDQECILLAHLIQEKKDIVRGKNSTGVCIQDKRQAWEEIVQTINASFPEVQRTPADCNKKWENLLAKAREEVKRQKRQLVKDEAMPLEQFSAVTQIVISVMNLTDMLQQDKQDSSVSQLIENQQDSNNDTTRDTIHHRITKKRPLTEHDLPIPSISSVQQKLTTSSGTSASLIDSGEHLDASCSASIQTAGSTSLQERMNLEMTVMRRQAAVLKLQQEYYTLKIKQLKMQMNESLQND
ncbi:uncharacterized protein LOC114436473 isoform X2 [Parambassis ranga]|uniref:Uncharacterized protein LOC114436473 isoform X2 n=1 Tax=Parambassis ranga TaxID=210632 RepID=A0A6P7IPK5_9TELE|nr:uncharacterized protein LOC114436473 isoform X2 [Parambassis ranga]